MNRHCRIAAFTLLAAGLLASAAPSHAYRLLQNNNTGRVIASFQVFCNDAGGFTHWNGRNFNWYHNDTAGQGSGKGAALTAAMQAWTNVSGTSHVLNYVGTTGAGWATDGQNTILWTTGNGCTTGCLALTALVLQSGQVIVESDIMFNNTYAWFTNGSAFDVQSVATHELGHSLGIAHTELTSSPPPTMVQNNAGDTAWRTLESDDVAALQCSENRYPPVCSPYNTVCSSNSDCCSGLCGIKTLPPRCF
jgi:hypothetical protein